WKAEADARLKRTAILCYVAQLLLNFSWSFIFFYARKPSWALVDIVFLWLLIASTIFWFAKIHKPAAWLLVPYILWVSFATALNFAIWQLN
ncbi:MAG: tryptophan-rich sensory protein, partial [Gloeobacteraceae cyanobacterium ES-bin-316]|nr:tryptophan-rich sensory protein [Ferruginibacter sp.]